MCNMSSGFVENDENMPPTEEKKNAWHDTYQWHLIFVCLFICVVGDNKILVLSGCLDMETEEVGYGDMDRSPLF